MPSAEPEPEGEKHNKPGLNFEHIGKALRWLRSQRSQKQREVAKSAEITPAMLSAYETGKHRPSLETVDSLLQALDCDVYDLTRALQIVAEGDVVRPKPRDPMHSSSLVTEAAEAPRIRMQPSEEELVQVLVPALLHLIRFLKNSDHNS